MTTAGEICNRLVVSATRDESIVDAARRMRDQHVGCLVVVERHARGRVPVAMLTDRDIVVHAVAEGSGAARLRVGDVATGPVRTVAVHEALPGVLHRMRTLGVRRLPVVDETGVLQGIVTFDDLVGLVARELGTLAKLLEHEQARERRGTRP